MPISQPHGWIAQSLSEAPPDPRLRGRRSAFPPSTAPNCGRQARMTRDYSAFLPRPARLPPTRAETALRALGWGPSFAAQDRRGDALAATPPVRVMAVHRAGMQVQGDGITAMLPPIPEATVGDWLLHDRDHPHDSRLLDRTSPDPPPRGPGATPGCSPSRPISTRVFVVYLVQRGFQRGPDGTLPCPRLRGGEMEPVILLTKTRPRGRSRALPSGRGRHLRPRARACARPRAAPTRWPHSRTGARRGGPWPSSARRGVGKSTLTNALLGVDKLATQAIRGRMTPRAVTPQRHRQLHAVPGGCLVLDTPGMRELQMAEAADGIADLFDDITALAAACRFSDCAHETEPGLRGARGHRGGHARGRPRVGGAGPSCRPRMPSTPPASPNAATATAPSARWCARRRNRPRTSGGL